MLSKEGAELKYLLQFDVGDQNSELTRVNLLHFGTVTAYLMVGRLDGSIQSQGT